MTAPAIASTADHTAMERPARNPARPTRNAAVPTAIDGDAQRHPVMMAYVAYRRQRPDMTT